jgi:hypothetical protein
MKRKVFIRGREQIIGTFREAECSYGLSLGLTLNTNARQRASGKEIRRIQNVDAYRDKVIGMFASVSLPR